MMQVNADGLLESLKEASGTNAVPAYDDSSALGASRPRRRRGPSQSTESPRSAERRRRAKTMSQVMVDHSRFGMGQ